MSLTIRPDDLTPQDRPFLRHALALGGVVCPTIGVAARTNTLTDLIADVLEALQYGPRTARALAETFGVHPCDRRLVGALKAVITAGRVIVGVTGGYRLRTGVAS